MPQHTAWEEEPDGTIVFAPENAGNGLIFYPGGKVEARAYIPLAVSLAKEGIFTVVVKMPFNLAVFGINSANRVIKEYDSVEKWFVGGHSLGGSMAASYAKKHQDKGAGVILLGAYSTADLSATGLSVFVAYGSNDGVMNMKKTTKMTKMAYVKLIEPLDYALNKLRSNEECEN